MVTYMQFVRNLAYCLNKNLNAEKDITHFFFFCRSLYFVFDHLFSGLYLFRRCYPLGFFLGCRSNLMHAGWDAHLFPSVCFMMHAVLWQAHYFLGHV